MALSKGGAGNDHKGVECRLKKYLFLATFLKFLNKYRPKTEGGGTGAVGTNCISSVNEVPHRRKSL